MIDRTGYCGWCKYRADEHGTHPNCEGCWFTAEKKNWELLICQVPPCVNEATDSGMCIACEVMEQIDKIDVEEK